ncbi:MAG: ATP-dependent Clp protease ATP-binding subunit [Alphaproteobacteria bacterium]|nr:MAG: ATP-dependent Clp protease ATP-binding subunit [Alphaproteobacteria bacterium]
MADDNNQKPAPAANLGPNSDYLIRGSDYLAKKPGFKAIGRETEMKQVSNILMRKDSNNVLLVGLPGVGVSSVSMGLQASKEDLNSPSDIVGKRFYWLDTDALFASGDATKVNEGFQKAIATLSRAPDTVLVIDDFKDFLDGCRNTGATNVINSLMREVRMNSAFQAIFEIRDTDLAEALKCHSDMKEIFTLMEIKEPTRPALVQMVDAGCKELEDHHKIKISDDARKTAIDLTCKYFIRELDSAQPKRAFMLLEGALTELRHAAHTHPRERDAVEAQLQGIASALGGKPPEDLKGKSAGELQTMKIEAEQEIVEINASWEDRQKKLRALYADQRKAEEEIRILDSKIEEERIKQIEAAKQLEKDQAAQKESEAPVTTKGLQFKLSKSGFKGTVEQQLSEERAQWDKLARDNRAKFDALTAEINEGLELKNEHILQEFSRLSGVPVSRLGQDETTKLLALDETLKKRVFGQDEPVKAVAKSVRRGRTGLKKANKPIGSFLFLGPSGVGKTELAKALAEALFGDESSLKVYNMSEYQEKHSVSTLIGAPPGYEGYADGGILTNAMRRQPYCVNVFDEIEKGHKDVYDLFLQILDEGMLTDRRGLTASFANSINIMTSNIGAEHFLDETISFDEAKKRALAVLWNPDKENGGSGYRPEFLNRFTGIFCFNRLGQPEIMMIADKTFKEINSWIAEQGLSVSMDKADKEKMCQDQYIPRGGARSIQKYIENNITSDISDTILRHPGEAGTLKVTYDKDAKVATTTFVSEGVEKKAPANENAPAKPKPVGTVFNASK